MYLAYIAGITAFGLVPRAALEVPGGERRLDRILSLVRACQYSIHDLSRVEIDPDPPATPRFNMPFEIGLSVMLAEYRVTHTWFVFESVNRRLEKSLSDLKGTEGYVHGGNPSGLFPALCDAFVRVRQQPTVQQMDAVYSGLKEHLPRIMHHAGAGSAFGTRVFSDLRYAAQLLATQQRPHPRRFLSQT